MQNRPSQSKSPPPTEELGGTGEGGRRGDSTRLPGGHSISQTWRGEFGARRVAGRLPVSPPEAASGSGLLPCQDSHNCTEPTTHTTPTSDPAPLPFPPSARRTAFALQLNVQAMCEQFGIEKVGFLTLTFAQHILDPKEAQRRMHSLTTHVLRPRYGHCIRVIERQKSGRIHYHLLVAVGRDIRTGADFDAFALGDYRTASPALRAEWSFWRATAKLYGFGRTELLPIRSTTEAIGRYVGKYIAKHIDQREDRDKGVRLVSYCGTKTANTRFAWAGGHAQQWRLKLRSFVHMLYDSGAIITPTLAAMRIQFGPRWAYKWRDSILAMPTQKIAS